MYIDDVMPDLVTWRNYPLFGERRPATDCSRMPKIIGYFSRKISHKTLKFYSVRWAWSRPCPSCMQLISVCFHSRGVATMVSRLPGNPPKELADKNGQGS